MIIEIPRVKDLEDLRRRINEVLRVINGELSREVITSKPMSGLESRFYSDMTVLENIKEHMELKNLAERIKDQIQNPSGNIVWRVTASSIEGMANNLVVVITEEAVEFSGEVRCLNGTRATTISGLHIYTNNLDANVINCHNYIDSENYYAEGYQGQTGTMSWIDGSGNSKSITFRDGLAISWG